MLNTVDSQFQEYTLRHMLGLQESQPLSICSIFVLLNHHIADTVATALPRSFSKSSNEQME